MGTINQTPAGKYSTTQANPDITAFVNLFSNGRFEEAEVVATSMTRQFPHDASAWKALGAALYHLGRLSDALPAMRKAAVLAPNAADSQNNLGLVLNDLGQLSAAEACYRRALLLDPNYAVASNNLGANLLGQERLGEAEACYRRAIEIDPHYAIAHTNLGSVLQLLGRLDQAEMSYRQAIKLKPSDAEALHNLGTVLQALDRLDEADACYRQALRIAPNHAEASFNLGNVLLGRGCAMEAATCYRVALQVKPDWAEAHANLGTALQDLGQIKEAEDCCRQALRIRPAFATPLLTMGHIMADLGRFNEADALFREALEIDPKIPEAWAALIRTRKATAADGEWFNAVDRLLSSGVSPADESRLRYALGKYFDDLHLFDQAFENFRRANELKKTFTKRYDPLECTTLTDRIILGQQREYLQALHALGSTSERPLFIVGMPRSGTSLVEQIVASHPATFGAGELSFWGEMTAKENLPVDARAWGAEMLRDVAGRYLANLSKHSVDAVRVVDKMPTNFFFLGMINCVFPKARILHVQRNPIDTCLSLYFHDFVFQHPYANDLDDAVRYYEDYRRLMEHWHSTLPADVLLDVPYEGLIENQEDWSRKIIEFIGLDWNERCLAFHKTARRVGTASNWQVRQEIYTTSKDRWRNYERYLGPLLRLLEREPTTTHAYQF